MIVYKNIFFLTVFLFSLSISFGQTYAELNKKCSEILKDISVEDSSFGKKILQRDSCLIGLKAPFFEATTLDKKKYNSKSLNGKILFLNFWFTSCIPCVREIPSLNKLVEKYKNNNVAFISFANDDSKKLIDFLKTTKFNFKVVPNSGQTLMNTFKLFPVWPTSVIIDKIGAIRLIKIGEIDYSSTIELIDDLLK